MNQDFQGPPFEGDIPSPSNTVFSKEPKEKTPIVELAFQHLVDCSIECPSPFALLEQDGVEPETQVSVDVGIAGEDDSFQVILALRIEIVKDQKSSCIIELKYAGYFVIKDGNEEMNPFLLYVHCPNMLWPSVRHWVRVVTLECGLPALSLTNVDFVELLKRKIEESQKS